MAMQDAIFRRSELLLGNEVMDRIAQKRVIIFGVGGVGSWCAESLVRTGIRRLTIVDSDRVSASNINRQLMATTTTVGQVKVDALKERLLQINPEADICAQQEVFCAETVERFHLETYDYIIDAIDSLSEKALLIRLATMTKAVFFSSMGAALKLDPTRIQVAEFWKVKGCPLAGALRQRFKRQKLFPARKFLCVVSDELLTNEGQPDPSETPQQNATEAADTTAAKPSAPDWNARKAQINGSLVHITAIFGFTMSGLVVQDIVAKTRR